AGSCIHRKAINKDKPTHPLAYCPPGSSVECEPILAHLLRRCTRLLMVLPSRQQSAMCSIMSCEDGSHIISTPQALQAAECYVSHRVLYV
ncbi:MAG: hypothetical protein SO158_07825, partial [Bacteroidaceae bacterium]|nr:hypothetical protein [Bacteroidaceae bacterium]